MGKNHIWKLSPFLGQIACFYPVSIFANNISSALLLVVPLVMDTRGTNRSCWSKCLSDCNLNLLDEILRCVLIFRIRAEGVCKFLTAAITHCHKENSTDLLSCGSSQGHQSPWAKITCWQSCIPSGVSRGDCLSLPFLASRDGLPSLACGPFLWFFKTSNAESNSHVASV